MGIVVMTCAETALSKRHDNAFLRLKTLLEQPFTDEKERLDTFLAAVSPYLSLLNCHVTLPNVIQLVTNPDANASLYDVLYETHA